MNGWLGEFWYQVLSVFLFAVALSAAFYFLAEKKQTEFLWSAFLAWVLLGAALAIYFNSQVLIEPETGGVLLPGRGENPPSGCIVEVPKDAIRIYLGNSLGYTTGNKQTIIRMAGEELLTIERKEAGISINARIYSRDRRVVAEIRDNRFFINPNNYFRRERPDKHTLIVYDQEAKEVINIRFVNPLAVFLTGKFYAPQRAPIVIEKDYVNISGNILVNNCFGGVGTIINVQ